MAVLFNDNSDAVRNAIINSIPPALEAVGLQAEGYAKRACPVDTGNLRNSISHTVSENVVYIGTNVEYAPYVELGTVKMAAQPYLKPAATDHKEQYEAIIARYINDGLSDFT